MPLVFLSLLGHEFLIARGHSPAAVLHPLQRTYPLHASLLTVGTGLVVLCATRLAYCARRAPRRDG